MDDVLSSATADQVIQLQGLEEGATRAAITLVANGVSTSGSGMLHWVEGAATTAVRHKYKMMCAMLKDARRNRCYAQSIERAVEHFTARNGRSPLVLDIGTGFGFLGNPLSSV